METYGKIRLRLSKLLPGSDPDLLDGWLQDRYTEILDSLPWPRQQKRAYIHTVAPHTSGTLSLLEGSAAVTGVGTNWTSALTGRELYVPSREETYTFTYVSATSGTLDRAFAGEALTDIGYKLFERYYALPVDVRILDLVGDLGPPISLVEAEALGLSFGTPCRYRHAMVESETMQMQIELIPQPEQPITLAIEYTAEATPPSATSTTLMPWLRPGCLIAGAYASGLAHSKELSLATYQEKTFEKLLGQMKTTAIANMPKKKLRMSPEFTRWAA